MSEPMLKAGEVADRLSVSEAAVYRALREGRLPGAKVLGTWRVDAEELESWIASKKVSRSTRADGEGTLARVHRLREVA